MTNAFDVAVIGLGAMGSAAVAHLAARGQRVIGLESHRPAHALSSSHGDSRLIRLGYFEDPSYVPLLRRAYENWRTLEADVGEPLLTITGVLEIGKHNSKIVQGTRASCELHGIAFETLERDAVSARYPAFALDADEVAIFEPEGGYLRPEKAVAAHLTMAARHGATLRFEERVVAIDPDDGGVTITTESERLRVRTCVVATGPWIAELVPDLRHVAQPIRQVVAWYRPADPSLTTPDRMPVFLRDEGTTGSFFGFPALGPEGYKVGKHAHLREPVVPDEANPPVNDADAALLDTFVRRRIPGAGGARVAATTCRYTMLPGEDFLMDRHPSEKRMIVASPCSGHGFKFASVVGEILADLALQGGSDHPIGLFSFASLERARQKAA